MKCGEAVDLVVDSLMDTLTGEQQQTLSEHLAMCAECSAEAEKLRSVWEDLARIPGLEDSPSVGHVPREDTIAARVTSAAVLSRVAAAVTLLFAGGAIGYGVRGPVTPTDPAASDDPAFLLLVRGEEPDERIAGPSLVAEYRDWGMGLAREGRLLGSNKLTDEPGRWISGSSQGDPRIGSDVQGYFIVSAADYDEAVRMALASPHIRYGGTFEIRRIDPPQ